MLARWYGQSLSSSYPLSLPSAADTYDFLSPPVVMSVLVAAVALLAAYGGLHVMLYVLLLVVGMWRVHRAFPQFVSLFFYLPFLF